MTRSWRSEPTRSCARSSDARRRATSARRRRSRRAEIRRSRRSRIAEAVATTIGLTHRASEAALWRSKGGSTARASAAPARAATSAVGRERHAGDRRGRKERSQGRKGPARRAARLLVSPRSPGHAAPPLHRCRGRVTGPCLIGRDASGTHGTGSIRVNGTAAGRHGRDPSGRTNRVHSRPRTTPPERGLTGD